MSSETTTSIRTITLEQAVYTSAETERSVGYQLIGRSDIRDEDAQVLSRWCPSHDSLISLQSDAVSYNFFTLPSGARCISRTTPAGWEYSGRGGFRIYTQCLILSADDFQRVGCSPFGLIRQAHAHGHFAVLDRVPEKLPSLQLPSRAPSVDQALLARLARNPGPRAMAVFVQMALDTEHLVVMSECSGANLLSGLMTCLPPLMRPEFSFSTGLKFSARRPLRVVALGDDRTELLRIRQTPGITVLDLDDEASVSAQPTEGWSRLVQQALASGRTGLLASEIARLREPIIKAELHALGLQLLEDIETAPNATPSVVSRKTAERPSRTAEESAAEGIRPGTREATELIEQLDDLVYEALGGSDESLAELRSQWPGAVEALGEDALEEPRRHYLRYALARWRKGAG